MKNKFVFWFTFFLMGFKCLNSMSSWLWQICDIFSRKKWNFSLPNYQWINMSSKKTSTKELEHKSKDMLKHEDPTSTMSDSDETELNFLPHPNIVLLRDPDIAERLKPKCDYVQHPNIKHDRMNKHSNCSKRVNSSNCIAASKCPEIDSFHSNKSICDGKQSSIRLDGRKFLIAKNSSNNSQNFAEKGKLKNKSSSRCQLKTPKSSKCDSFNICQACQNKKSSGSRMMINQNDLTASHTSACTPKQSKSVCSFKNSDGLSQASKNSNVTVQKSKSQAFLVKPSMKVHSNCSNSILKCPSKSKSTASCCSMDICSDCAAQDLKKSKSKSKSFLALPSCQSIDACKDCAESVRKIASKTQSIASCKSADICEECAEYAKNVLQNYTVQIQLDELSTEKSRSNVRMQEEPSKITVSQKPSITAKKSALRQPSESLKRHVVSVASLCGEIKIPEAQINVSSLEQMNKPSRTISQLSVKSKLSSSSKQPLQDSLGVNQDVLPFNDEPGVPHTPETSLDVLPSAPSSSSKYFFHL